MGALHLKTTGHRNRLADACPVQSAFLTINAEDYKGVIEQTTRKTSELGDGRSVRVGIRGVIPFQTNLSISRFAGDDVGITG